MSDLKVGRPKTAIAGAVLALACAVATILILSLSLAIMGQEMTYWVAGADAEAVAYWYIYCGFLLAGGILILRRRYRLGGIFVLIFGILLTVSFDWLVGIWGIIGGILALVSKEKAPARVLEVARLHGRIGIKDLAATIGKTEADVELSIINLQSKGQPIRFDAERREVIYG